MIGLIYPGVSRLDYRLSTTRAAFPPAHRVEQRSGRGPLAGRGDPHGPGGAAARRLQPLGVKNLDPQWIRRLGQTGKDCYDAILRRDVKALGASMNECMKCWEAILPHTVRHPTISVDLLAILGYYQSTYPGAMYSGCGGGYLYVVSETPVPGSFRVTVRVARDG